MSSGFSLRFIPSKIMAPFEIFPGSSIRFIIALPKVLFPDPDSPTRPSISPFLTSIFIFLTA